MEAWAIEVMARLWLAGVVSQHWDRLLMDWLFKRVRALCPFLQGWLVWTDECAASPKRLLRAFREKVKMQPGRGRCSVKPWPDLCITMVIKHTRKKRVGEITRTVARGTHEKAKKLLAATKGWTEFNTAFLERVNGTFRERLASFTRTCRYADAHIPRVAQRDAHVAEAASQNRSLLVLV